MNAPIKTVQTLSNKWCWWCDKERVGEFRSYQMGQVGNPNYGIALGFCKDHTNMEPSDCTAVHVLEGVVLV